MTAYVVHMYYVFQIFRVIFYTLQAHLFTTILLPRVTLFSKFIIGVTPLHAVARQFLSMFLFNLP